MTNPYAVPMQPYKKGGPGGSPPPHGKPENYLIHSILATLCCCVPFGIVAIVFAAQVDGKWNSGDWQGALETSDKAKLFCWISFGLGLAGAVIGVGLQLMAEAAELN